MVEIELATDHLVVLENAVVDDRKTSITVNMRMGIRLGHSAVGRPPRVADRHHGRRQPERRVLAHFADTLLKRYLAASDARDAPGIVAAVFQRLERPQGQFGGGGLPTAVRENAAHGNAPS